MKTQFKAPRDHHRLIGLLSASAMTIDFTELATDQTFINVANPFQSKGFTFSTTHALFCAWGKTQAQNAPTKWRSHHRS